MIQPAPSANPDGAAMPSAGRSEASSRAADGLKKKPQPNLTEAPVAAANINEPGVAVIPQIAPVAKSEERTTHDAPRPTRNSLFDLMSAAQKVPVLQAKEAALPRNTNVIDAKEALEKIQQSWRRILEQVTAQRISLGAFLELGLPTSLTDGTLEVCFDQGSGFQINSVNNQKTFIQEVIGRETGYRVRIVCRKDESNTLHEVRTRMQRLGHSSNMPAPKAAVAAPDGEMAKSGVAVAPEMGEIAPPALMIAPANGAAKNAGGEAQVNPGVAAPATLSDLYRANPAIQKLVEALDGELI
jgi:hypothetical protein